MGTVAQEIARIQGAKAAIKTAIEGKGVTVPSSTKIDGYAALVDSIQQGGGTGIERKDVNFYDYDGTVVASYTAQEFAALSAMPNNPTHEGLISQGWNWTLSDAKTYVAAYGKLEVGQMFITDDGSTRLYVSIPTFDRKNITVSWSQNEPCVIDWGDGETETVTGSGWIVKDHNYASPGDYVISIDPGEGSIALNGYTLIPSDPYKLYLWKLELGKVSALGGLAYFRGLKYVTLPDGITETAYTMFWQCSSLKHITIPKSVSVIGGFLVPGCSALESISFNKEVSTFSGTTTMSGCTSLRRITIPPGITSLPDNLFDSGALCSEIVIPNGITSIGYCAFYQTGLVRITLPSSVENISALALYSLGMATVICKASTPPTITDTSIPSSVETIYVPAASVDVYKAATNWSSFAAKIQAIPE